jgi:hypothetical protein
MKLTSYKYSPKGASKNTYIFLSSSVEAFLKNSIKNFQTDSSQKINSLVYSLPFLTAKINSFYNQFLIFNNILQQATMPFKNPRKYFFKNVFFNKIITKFKTLFASKYNLLRRKELATIKKMSKYLQSLVKQNNLITGSTNTQIINTINKLHSNLGLRLKL